MFNPQIISMQRSSARVVRVDPKPKNGLASKALDLMERAFLFFSKKDTPPLHFLSYNFKPIRHETPPCPNLPVHGTIPACLNGEYCMVGSNPQFVPLAGYHWFDGDGMIHGLRVKDGKATYVSRYVKTSRFKQEEYFGGAKFLKIADIKGLFGLFMIQIHLLREKFKVLDVSYGAGTANTSLVYHNEKLLALHEGDKPYVIKVLGDGDLQTLGILDYDERLQHSFTSHPKVDPVTDEMFTFGYSTSPPYVSYRVITKEGVMHDPVPITIPNPVMMHDFAITEHYAIFMDLPSYFEPKGLVKGKHIYNFDVTKKARFGLLPRYAKDDHQIRWFELPNCYIFHIANAWEEGDEVVLVTCRIQNFDFEFFSGPVKDQHETLTTELYEMRFNIKTGAALQRQLSNPSLDFPRINENYTGRKQRYVYTLLFDKVKPKAVVKFDLHAEPKIGNKKCEVGGNIKGIFEFGPGRYGSDPVFVPRVTGISSDEDDGYLICIVHDENTGKSEVNVINAKTMSPDPEAIVELPNRVPFGFHAFFMTEEQIQNQA